jgi:hypothetical protein
MVDKVLERFLKVVLGVRILGFNVDLLDFKTVECLKAL